MGTNQGLEGDLSEPCKLRQIVLSSVNFYQHNFFQGEIGAIPARQKVS